MKNVLIIGASGFLGKELYKCFSKDEHYRVFGTYMNTKVEGLLKLDMLDVVNLGAVFNNIKPNVVIITSALTNVEYCETHKEEAYRLNVIGVKNILDKCKEYFSKVIYVSTEYVFDGTEGPYVEEDEENPINYYGITKLLAEGIVKDNDIDYLIARTTVIYGFDLDSKNFIMQLIKTLSRNINMRVPSDQISSPTYCPNLAEMLKEACDKNISGVYNMVGSDVVDRYAFACIASDILGLKKELLIPVSTSELNQIAKRPLKAGLYINKIKNELDIGPMSVEEGLKALANVSKFERLNNE